MRLFLSFLAYALLPATACDIPVFRCGLEHCTENDFYPETTEEIVGVLSNAIPDANLEVTKNTDLPESRIGLLLNFHWPRALKAAGSAVADLLSCASKFLLRRMS